MLHRSKRFSVKVCYGWGRSSSSATMLTPLTREIAIYSFTKFWQYCFSVINFYFLYICGTDQSREA